MEHCTGVLALYRHRPPKIQAKKWWDQNAEHIRPPKIQAKKWWIKMLNISIDGKRYQCWVITKEYFTTENISNNYRWVRKNDLALLHVHVACNHWHTIGKMNGYEGEFPAQRASDAENVSTNVWHFIAILFHLTKTPTHLIHLGCIP